MLHDGLRGGFVGVLHYLHKDAVALFAAALEEAKDEDAVRRQWHPRITFFSIPLFASGIEGRVIDLHFPTQIDQLPLVLVDDFAEIAVPEMRGAFIHLGECGGVVCLFAHGGREVIAHEAVEYGLALLGGDAGVVVFHTVTQSVSTPAASQ